MAYWLFKQEPSTYSFSQLEKDGKTVWDGVTNNLAQKHLKSVRRGDKALFYHTGAEKQVVGIIEAVSDPYPDPKDKSLTVVDVRPLTRLAKPVTLEAIKQNPVFSSWELVRIPRLSVMPVPNKLWELIMKMGQ